MSQPNSNSRTQNLGGMMIGLATVLAIVIIGTSPNQSFEAISANPDSPQPLMGSSESHPEASVTAPPPPPEPAVMAAPAAPRPTSTEQSGTGSLIPVTAMPDSGMYDQMIRAMAGRSSELSQVADASPSSFEGKACRAYALAIMDELAAAETAVSGLIGSDTDLRQQSFLLVVQSEIAMKRSQSASAAKLLDDAVDRMVDVHGGTEGAALANLASARYYHAIGNREKAKLQSEMALKRATTTAERTLAAKYQ